MINKIVKFLRLIRNYNVKLDNIQQSLGRIEFRQLNQVDSNNINNYEFKVFSQSGEDGIIQYLIQNININNKIFIEFGVENYLESNTRFLALNNYWSGLIIDGDQSNIDFIKKDPIYWRCNIKAECSFITKDNINDIFLKNGITGDIGILSVDIDGNDYWVWQSINNINPAIIIAEYNSFFGSDRAVTVPYDASFIRNNAHFSKIYYGASITALTNLANKRGYKLVASNNSGNNVFYIREDLLGNIKEVSIGDVFRKINFREAHNSNGELIYADFDKARELIKNMPLYDLDKEQMIYVKDLF